jgi:hypothetical protein
MWREQNRIELRTSSDRASERLTEILGRNHLPAKVLGIGCLVALALIATAWLVNPILATVCSIMAFTSSLILAWSLGRNGSA